MKISTNQYATTLYELTQDKNKPEIDAVVKKFSEQLIKSRKNRLVGKIIKKFNGIYNQKNGIIEAEITSREMLSNELRNNVSNYVSTKYKAKEVVIINKIDESIKGGIVIKVGDEILDASIKNHLINLSKLLKI